MNLFLTGERGFIGSFLYPRLVRQGMRVCCATKGGQAVRFHRSTRFAPFLKSADAVIHLAGLAHKPLKKDPGFEARLWEANFLATQNLAWQAADAGVRRFVFMSSISVGGEQGTGLQETDPERPGNAYALSKLRAEQVLMETGEKTGMEVVVLRPPLVYGPGVKANFLKLLGLVRSGVPLPFARIANQRSLISLNNLADAVILGLTHERAPGQVFYLADETQVSTTKLVEMIGQAMGRPVRLFHLPPKAARQLLVMAGKKRVHDSLWGSLTADTSKIRDRLGWHPRVSMGQGIDETVQWYLSGQRSRAERRGV